MKNLKKWIKRITLIILALLLLLQFFKPRRTNPPVDISITFESKLNPPKDVQDIMKRSCYDCHSNTSSWPWYSGISPISWMIVDDVTTARSMLNFSEWGNYKTSKAVSKLDAMTDEISSRGMPLKRYLLLHPDAELTQPEIDRFCDWLEAVKDSLSEAK